MKKIIVLLLLLYLTQFLTHLLGQDIAGERDRRHSVFIQTQVSQVKDELAYGLVYRGVNLITGYSVTKISDHKLIAYTGSLGFGANFNKGVGLAWKFMPVDVFYGYKTSSNSFTYGANFTANYNWQQYSELQGGRLFWLTAIQFGPQVMINLPYSSQNIIITLSNSLAGFTSRPPAMTETYFYSFNLSEFISSAHEDLTFGSFGSFNRTSLKIEVQGKSENRLSFDYKFEFLGYYKPPTSSYLNHSLSLKWKIGSL